MPASRRQFMGRVAAACAGTQGVTLLSGAETNPSQATTLRPLVVSTWPFGRASNDEALKVMTRGGSLLDAIEQGIWVTENDQNNHSVGLGGTPNAAGVTQLDSCIMDGLTHRAGSVAALEGIRHPISAARRVMEKTRHVMLVGEGARLFALEEGLESVPTDAENLYRAWRLKRGIKTSASSGDASGAGRDAGASGGKGNHDTIALLILGPGGNLAGGCSTSGLGGKLPGRVGDSPILGSGLYVDNEVGAAGATGVGENVMCYCASFLIVELMRQGLSPEDACREAIRRIVRQEPAGKQLDINFVALDKRGRYGAAGTSDGFAYSVTLPGSSQVLTVTKS